MATITLEHVRTAALAALEAEGDHRYTFPLKGQASCTYTTPDGAPSCVVGHVIFRVEPETLPLIGTREWEQWVEHGSDEEAESFNPATFNADELNLDSHRHGSKNTYSDAALCWLVRVQIKQDTGKPWSAAIATADVDTVSVAANYPNDFNAEDRAYLATINVSVPTGGAAL